MTELTSTIFQTNQAPRQLVIVLHGLGASGSEIIILASAGLARQLPEAVFLAPDAPFAYNSGRQWFGFDSDDHSHLLGQMDIARPVLDRFIDQSLERYGLDDSKLGLLGFSQGAMMALHNSLRRSRPCAAVVGYSGALIGGDYLAEQIVSRPPVLLVHGEQDEVIPAQALPLSEQYLRKCEVEVTTLSRPQVGHLIDPEGLRAGGEFLARYLATKSGG